MEGADVTVAWQKRSKREDMYPTGPSGPTTGGCSGNQSSLPTDVHGSGRTSKTRLEATMGVTDFAGSMQHLLDDNIEKRVLVKSDVLASTEGGEQTSKTRLEPAGSSWIQGWLRQCRMSAAPSTFQQMLDSWQQAHPIPDTKLKSEDAGRTSET